MHLPLLFTLSTLFSLSLSQQHPFTFTANTTSTPITMPPTLYSFAESGNSYRVRLLASLLHIPLEVREMDFPKDTKTEWFLALNPRGTIPCLVVAEEEGDGVEEGLVLRDSVAILMYLAGRWPAGGDGKVQNEFGGKDIVERARIADWLAFAGAWMENGLSKARGILNFHATVDEELLKTAQARGHKSLEILDQRLSSREWLALERPTIADVAVFPYVALAPMGDVSLEGYPRVRAWIERVKGLEGFVGMKGLEDPMYRRRR